MQETGPVSRFFLNRFRFNLHFESTGADAQPQKARYDLAMSNKIFMPDTKSSRRPFHLFWADFLRYLSICLIYVDIISNVK